MSGVTGFRGSPAVGSVVAVSDRLFCLLCSHVVLCVCILDITFRLS